MAAACRRRSCPVSGRRAPARRHFGLHNVDAILRIRYGPDRGVRFVPVQGEGACITSHFRFSGKERNRQLKVVVVEDEELVRRASC